ncbi:MAG: hypothetical protein ACR2L1_05255, partial [Pyrinomonadaceae bacterium]
IERTGSFMKAEENGQSQLDDTVGEFILNEQILKKLKPKSSVFNSFLNSPTVSLDAVNPKLNLFYHHKESLQAFRMFFPFDN